MQGRDKLDILLRARKIQEYKKKVELAKVNQNIMKGQSQIKKINQDTMDAYNLLKEIDQQQGKELPRSCYNYIQFNYEKIKKIKNYSHELEKEYSSKKKDFYKAMKDSKVVEELKTKKDKEKKEKIDKKIWEDIADTIFSRRARRL